MINGINSEFMSNKRVAQYYLVQDLLYLDGLVKKLGKELET